MKTRNELMGYFASLDLTDSGVRSFLARLLTGVADLNLYRIVLEHLVAGNIAISDFNDVVGTLLPDDPDDTLYHRLTETDIEILIQQCLATMGISGSLWPEKVVLYDPEIAAVYQTRIAEVLKAKYALTVTASDIPENKPSYRISTRRYERARVEIVHDQSATDETVTNLRNKLKTMTYRR